MTADTSHVARRLEIDGVMYHGLMDDVGIDMAEGAHDKAVLSIRAGQNPLDFSMVVGKRLRFEYGFFPRQTFYGYATELTPAVRAKTGKGHQQTITALGVTAPLKAGAPQFWTNVTVPDVINEIAALYGLGFNDESDPSKTRTVFKSLAQADESDWEFVTHIASMVGASVFCENGVLRLITPEWVSSRYRPVATFWRNYKYGQEVLYEFTPSNFSPHLPEANEPEVAFLSGSDVIVREPRTSPAVRRFSAKRAFANDDEAAVMQSVQYGGPRWLSEGTADVSGTTAIVPGTLVMFRSSVKSFMAAPYEGVWYVSQVTHNVVPKNFHTFLQVRRYPYTEGAGVVPNWWNNQLGVPRVIAGNNNRWVCSWRP